MRNTLLYFVLLFPMAVLAQEKVEINEYTFSAVKDLDAQPVQNQNRTGTCWSFSTLSFMESEVMRIKGMEVKLAEMWIVRHTYLEKAERYVRFHGKVNFDEGGAFHDVTEMIKKYGIVPQEVYSGLNYGSDMHYHAELRNVLRAMCDEIIKNPNRKLSTAWKDAVTAVIDAYLGAPVSKFEYNGKSYTPMSFAKYCGINAEDYVIISSFTHQPMYEPFIIELPDNWLHQTAYNVSLDEMMNVISGSIEEGFTSAWAADVSERGFSHSNGVAIIPEGNFDGLDRASGDALLKKPTKQENITVEMRQLGYDNYTTTDDHGMHITGMYKEANGDTYYKVKNSWGVESNDCDGFLFASDSYVRYKTIDVMLHKDALPKALRKKLNIK